MQMNRVEIDAGSLASLPDPGAREFVLPPNGFAFGGFVVLCQGQVRAFVNLCPHARRPLNFSPDVFLDRNRPEIICTGHGARFNADNGICVSGPCIGQRLTALDVRVRNDTLFVSWDSSAVAGARNSP
jgi:nitrite reductase/ring-hydroxylating ferredoxin subunit